jgi:hypothetical protein
MWFAAIIPLLSGLFGENGPLGQYFKSKAQQVQAAEEFKLAQLKSQTDCVLAQTAADTAQRSNYLNATSNGFRQGTFYWFSAIILYSIVFPDKAEVMWHNFSLIPEWVQMIYAAMLSVAWGLPVAKENIGLIFSSIGRGLDARREFRLAKINREAVFNSLRNGMFPKGMDPNQVKIVDDALDAGEK